MAAAQVDLDAFRNRVVGRSITEQTFRQYRIWIRRYETWKTAEDPTASQLIDFDTLLKDGTITDYPWVNGKGRPAPDEYAYRSRQQALSAIKIWARYTYDTEITTKVQNLVAGEPEPFDPPYLSLNDVEKTIQNANDDCPVRGCQAALAVTYDAILRAAEFVTIRRGDLDLDNGTLRVRAVKGSEPATLQLEDRTVNLLEQHIRDTNPGSKVFKNTYGNGWKASSWASHFRNKHHEAGAHSFGRHSPIMHRLQYPKEFYDLDGDADVFGRTYQRARHSHPQMTSRYAKLVGVDIPDWGED